ncbi:hypothetical protein WR25_11049 [Diploscapter pachys]|uniref:Uncharacterized protein n=1 Tax=Diploscapter pachys TaxID=2018661 RepID=A0A2A2LTQ6_9BILA|nr:hypothetical protein WR25_11049 [Diploscapter pachys]
MVQLVSTGAVGKCSTACAERNQGKIVRVFLKGEKVMVGVCKNNTVDPRPGHRSLVFPLTCNRFVGVWSLDFEEEEGIRPFSVNCPPNKGVPQSMLDECPTLNQPTVADANEHLNKL